MNLVDAVLDRLRSLPQPGAEDFVCHTPQPIPPVDDDDDDDEDEDRGSGGGNIDPDDDEGGFDDDDDEDTLWLDAAAAWRGDKTFRHSREGGNPASLPNDTGSPRPRGRQASEAINR